MKRLARVAILLLVTLVAIGSLGIAYLYVAHAGRPGGTDELSLRDIASELTRDTVEPSSLGRPFTSTLSVRSYLPIVTKLFSRLPESTVAVVGSAGGVLQLADGTTLEVPAGALEQDVVIGITEARPLVTLPGGMISNDGYATHFTPNGLIFQKPVTIRFNVPVGVDPRFTAIYSYNEDRQAWELAPSWLENSRPSAALTHFSWWEDFTCSWDLRNPESVQAFWIDEVHLNGEGNSYHDGDTIFLDPNDSSPYLLFNVRTRDNAFACNNATADCETSIGTAVDLWVNNGNQHITEPPGNYFQLDFCPSVNVPGNYFCRVCNLSTFPVKWSLPAAYRPENDSPIPISVKIGWDPGAEQRPERLWPDCYRIWDTMSLTLRQANTTSYLNHFTNLNGWVQSVGLINGRCGQPMQQRESIIYGTSGDQAAYTALPSTISGSGVLAVEIRARFNQDREMHMGLTSSNALTCGAAHFLRNSGWSLSWGGEAGDKVILSFNSPRTGNTTKQYNYSKTHDNNFHVWRLVRDTQGYWRVYEDGVLKLTAPLPDDSNNFRYLTVQGQFYGSTVISEIDYIDVQFASSLEK